MHFSPTHKEIHDMKKKDNVKNVLELLNFRKNLYEPAQFIIHNAIPVT